MQATDCNRSTFISASASPFPADIHPQADPETSFLPPKPQPQSQSQPRRPRLPTSPPGHHPSTRTTKNTNKTLRKRHLLKDSIIIFRRRRSMQSHEDRRRKSKVYMKLSPPLAFHSPLRLSPNYIPDYIHTVVSVSLSSPETRKRAKSNRYAMQPEPEKVYPKRAKKTIKN